MTRPEMDAEVKRIRSVIGPEKESHVVAVIDGVKRACGSDGPAIAEAFANAMIVHALGQPSPRACIASVVEMLNAGIDLFLFMRAEAAAKELS